MLFFAMEILHFIMLMIFIRSLCITFHVIVEFHAEYFKIIPINFYGNFLKDFKIFEGFLNFLNLEQNGKWNSMQIFPYP